ncbi:MAG TPA: hypothetical protein DCY10_06935 [Clostridiales bacterium]|jgi:hypothetical protein|nr:hypothetical protein [Clostridiales bacterium]
MPQNNRKPHIVCRRCKTRFSGIYCPYCGAENGVVRSVRGRGGLLAGLLRFLLSVVALSLILAIAFAILDYVASASGDGRGAARAILDSARYAIPQSVLDVYATIKVQYLDGWVASVSEFFRVLFS